MLLVKLMDGVTTWYFLRLGFSEGNPLALALITSYGICRATILQLLVMSGYVLGLRWLQGKLDHWLFRFACDFSYNFGLFLGVGVIVWNLYNTYLGLLLRSMGVPF